MSQFFHHDGLINIDDGINSLTISLAEFLTYEPTYTLLAPYITRFYNPGISHLLFDANNNQFFGGLPYAVGDGFIANLATYITAHNTPDTLAQAKIDKKAAVDSLNGMKKLGHVLLFATEMFSSGVSPQQLISYNELAAVPAGFYIRDINNVDILLTLVNFNALNNGIVQLHNKCDINSDDLKDAIDALGTIAAVVAFNIDTGWPTVPYTPV